MLLGGQLEDISPQNHHLLLMRHSQNGMLFFPIHAKTKQQKVNMTVVLTLVQFPNISNFYKVIGIP